MTDNPELEAHGISSAVDEQHRTHILMLDYDDYEVSDRIMDKVTVLEGVTALMESSDGSWHVVNFTVRDLDETALELLRLKSDPMRTMMGYTWRPPRWVSRLGPKTAPDGSEAKGSPTLKGLQYEPTDREQAQGHFNVFGAFIDGWPSEGPEGVNWRPTTPTVEKYKTFRDGEK